MKGMKIKGKERTATGMYIRSTSVIVPKGKDMRNLYILPNRNDMRSIADMTKLYELMDEIIEGFGTNQCAKSSRQHEYMKTYDEWKISPITIIKQKRLYSTKYIG